MTWRQNPERRAHQHDDFDGPHLDQLVNDFVSAMAPFSALILTIIMVILFLIKLYVVERILMRTKRCRCHLIV